jgi:anti-sigma regulatory factor (Ser/Thr protein kinase)
MGGGWEPVSGGQPVTLLRQRFGRHDVPGLRRLVDRCVAAVGVADERRDDFVLAVNELLTNAVRHGGGTGLLHLHRIGDTLTCEVSDYGPGLSAGDVDLSGPPPATQPGGRGLWFAAQLADRIEISRNAVGASVTVTVRLKDQLWTARHQRPDSATAHRHCRPEVRDDHR